MDGQMSRVETVNVAKAAELMNVGASTVKDWIAAGKLEAALTLSALGGGAGGTAYRVNVDSLPAEAQIKYWQGSGLAEIGAGCQEFDLVGYKARKGDSGMKELLRRQRAALAAHGLRARYEDQAMRGYTEALAGLSEALGIPAMTLYRWERGYAAQGLKGIARPIRADAGQSRSMCYLARDYIEYLMYDKRKLPQSRVLEKLNETAKALGPDACEHCPYRCASEEREALVMAHGDELPMCEQGGKGMIPPDSRYAVNRAVGLISESALAYARYGSRYWDDKYLQKVVRKKPELANEVWFGDHHKLDLFVLDRDGRAVRPWLTAWMDAQSSAIVGWMLTLEPNSDTIAESFARAAVATKGSIFVGLPRVAYIDNGKDYQSIRFEGGQYLEKSLGKINDDFWRKSMLEALCVEVKHAIPYWAWSKPIERLFGTLEKRWMKEFPAWCGDSPEERPQDLGADIRAGRIMTFEDFAVCFKRDVIDAYHHFRGGEDNRTPLERYEMAQKARMDHPSWATMCLLKGMNTTRQVRTQGITIDNRLYQDRALGELIGKSVTVLYNRGPNESVSILHNGQFVCEAVCAEVLDMIERDTDKLRDVMAEKKRQRNEVRSQIAAIAQSVRGVHREAYAEEIDAQRDRALSRVGNIEGIKVQRAKAEVATQKKRRAGELDAGARAVNDMFGAMGAEMLRKTREG
ncbi:MAG: transposase family protein [Clostridia bacterium]